MKRVLITIYFLLLIVGTSVSWRRRRRRRCGPVNCRVGSWTSWGSCSHQCGTSGTQRRTRQQTQAAYCGGSCPYSFSETQACNRGNCQNGGTPHSSGCSCRAGYRWTCCEYDVNECQNSPCQHTCTNTFGSFTCSCHSCYTKVGYNCDLRQCKISNQCYSYGFVNPGNRCQDCNSTNKQAWTNNNALPCNDNVACTRNDRCSKGVCAGTPFSCLPCEECYNDTCRVKPGFCLINDSGTQQCFNHGDVRPGYPCQDCNSTSNNLAWTNNNALSCNDNKPCTKNDQCSNGVCSGTPFTCLSCEECYNETCQVKPGFCAINDGGTRKCANGGALRPGYPCQWCYPCNSSSTWSNLDGVACDDENKCTRMESCHRKK